MRMGSITFLRGSAVSKAVQALRTFLGHPPQAGRWARGRVVEGEERSLPEIGHWQSEGAHPARWQLPPPLIGHPPTRPPQMAAWGPAPPVPPPPRLDQAPGPCLLSLWAGPCGACPACPGCPDLGGGPGVRLEHPRPRPRPHPTHPSPHPTTHTDATRAPPPSSAMASSSFLRLLLVLGTWMALAAAGAFNTAGDGPVCASTKLHTQLKRRNQERRHPGQGVRLKGTWTNWDRDRTRTVTNGVLQLQLPPHTTYKSSSAKTKKWHSPARLGTKRPTYDPATRRLTWHDITLNPGGTVHFVVHVKLDPCYAGPRLDFNTSAFVDTNGVATCVQKAVTSVNVVRRKNGRKSGSCAPTPAPTPAPSKMPSIMPTLMPSAAPTVSCVPGEFRPAPTAPCAFCAPGTYWNETSPAIQATSCQPCAEGATSLQGATACYTPCQPNSALNTTDLTCRPIPAAANDLPIDLNTSTIFIVTEPDKLEDTIGAAAAASNETTVVIVLGPGLYPQTAAYTLTSNVVILADSTGGVARRRLGDLANDGRRHLQTTIVDTHHLRDFKQPPLHHVQRVLVYGRRRLPRLLDRLLFGRRGASEPRPRALLQHDLP